MMGLPQEQANEGKAFPCHFIVVGAGFGGLTAAIELKRKGFSVEIVEAAPEMTTIGDSIQIGSSGTRVISNWGSGSVIDIMSKQAAKPLKMTLYNSDGELMIDAPLPQEFDGYPILFPLRGYSQKVIYEHAVSIGVKFRLDSRVSSYFEEDDCAGVVVNNERLKADGVIAGDGVHSTGRAFIKGVKEHPRTSGFAVYRSSFPLAVLAQDPRLQHFVNAKEDLFHVWIGTNVHAIVLINVEMQNVVVFCTHTDHYEVEESWSFKGDHADMLKVVDGWDETIRAVIRLIPPEVIIDWKLLWRNPVKPWVSKTGRIVLVGDAAHPHLPTSGTGATQAIEDGATIAALIESFGVDDIPLAFRAFERLRYERTSLTQRMGWETRHRWHQTDWEFVKSHPEFLKMPQPRWLYGHDARKYAQDRAEEVARSIKDPSVPFKSTNIPEDHIHEDWTVEMMLALENKEAQEHFYKVANK